jgi:hypothetical protein
LASLIKQHRRIAIAVAERILSANARDHNSRQKRGNNQRFNFHEHGFSSSKNQISVISDSMVCPAFLKISV